MIKEHLKAYYDLAKPGIVYGNLLSAVAGFFFASALEHRAFGGAFGSGLFVAFAVGTAFVIGSACAFNNYLDRDIDAKMERTRSRALVQGTIAGTNALIYATCLGVLGTALLFLYANALAAWLELLGLFSYVVLYGLAKRRTEQGVLVGSIPGAIPVVAGFAAVVGHLDLAALILFLILVFWQMPHFYGIALYRADEYRAAAIPVLPLRRGSLRTKIETLAYAALFLIASLSLVFFKFTGYIYFAAMAVVGLVWILLSIKGFSVSEKDEAAWAKTIFLSSLAVIAIFSLAVSVGPLLV